MIPMRIPPKYARNGKTQTIRNRREAPRRATSRLPGGWRETMSLERYRHEIRSVEQVGAAIPQHADDGYTGESGLRMVEPDRGKYYILAR